MGYELYGFVGILMEDSFILEAYFDLDKIYYDSCLDKQICQSKEFYKPKVKFYKPFSRGCFSKDYYGERLKYIPAKFFLKILEQEIEEQEIDWWAYDSIRYTINKLIKRERKRLKKNQWEIYVVLFGH